MKKKISTSIKLNIFPKIRSARHYTMNESISRNFLGGIFSESKNLIFMENIQKIFREISFLAVLNFFPVQKLYFGHF